LQQQNFLFYSPDSIEMKKPCGLTMIFSILAGIVFLLTACVQPSEKQETVFLPKEFFSVPDRETGQTDVLELRCEPLSNVRIAVIGLGMRGSEAVRRLSYIEGATITVLCDVVPDRVTQAQKLLTEMGKPKAAGYSGEEEWKLVCQREDVDLVYVCTHWDLHTPIAVYAMEQGKHVAVEVPAALTIDECWQLVNTAEKTRRHCMMLENCNYDFFEMATLNMARNGLFGEIVHVEGAYIHDLRWLNFDDSTGYWNMWRLKHNENNNGNLYPTHGLGPLAHILNIHRGDKMDYLVSVSSNQFGMSAYAREKFGEDSDFAKKNYDKGDMNTTIIKTHNGKTMMIQHDVTSPRPYSRIHLVSGTKGFARKWPQKGIALEPDAHHFLSEKDLEALLAQYEHPIVTEVGQKAKEVGGHGGMDFIMDYRLIYCLRNGLPLDQDVYDAAEWSAIIQLSKISVANHGMPVAIPDFTRGEWDELKQVTYYTR